jgi:predicted nuclease of predicted toxin-antitoxin system
VRFLVDQNRSPALAERLRDAGHDAVHTMELGLERAEDDELLLLAREEQRVVISGDTDFGALLALANATSPSVILFRSRDRRSADDQATLLLSHLNDVEGDLIAGAVVVITDDRIRVRRLPLLHDQ